MPGVKGRSGTGPKTDEHKAAIRAGVQAFWDSEEGRALRESARAAAEVRRNQLRQEKHDAG